MNDQARTYFVKGVCPVALAAILWGVGYYILKYVSQDIGTFTRLFMYSIGAALFLFVVQPRNGKGFASRFADNWRFLTLMSLCSVTFGAAAMNFGLQYVDLGVSSLLERTQIIFTVIVAAIFLHERLTTTAIVLGVVGTIATLFLVPAKLSLTTFDLTGQTVLGSLSIIGAAFIWAFSGVLGRRLATQKVLAWDMSMVRALTGIVTMLPLMLLFDNVHIGLSAFRQASMLAILSGIIAGGIGYTACYYGLKILSIGVACMLESLTPVVSLVLGILLLDESLSPTQWIAATVSLVSLTSLVWVEGRAQQKAVRAQI